MINHSPVITIDSWYIYIYICKPFPVIFVVYDIVIYPHYNIFFAHQIGDLIFSGVPEPKSQRNEASEKCQVWVESSPCLFGGVPSGNLT